MDSELKKPVTIPTYDMLMLPVLKLCAGRAWLVRDLVSEVSDSLNLTETERGYLLPSGGGTVIGSRVQWAKTYLKQAGLLEQPKRAFVQIIDAGTHLLAQDPPKIDIALLRQYAGFRAFQNRSESKVASQAAALDIVNSVVAVQPTSTPEEQVALGAAALEISLRDALLARILESSPAFFERMIIDVLLAMGYGGSRSDAGEHLGGTGDGGIDGVIREDQLGLDQIYLQAKRYAANNSVGSPEVQSFIGALVGKGAQKGVLITTSTFSQAAKNAAKQSGALRIVLIDGDELTRLMVRFGVGVRVAQKVEIKRVDLDYFEEIASD